MAELLRCEVQYATFPTEREAMAESTPTSSRLKKPHMTGDGDGVIS